MDKIELDLFENQFNTKFEVPKITLQERNLSKRVSHFDKMIKSPEQKEEERNLEIETSFRDINDRFYSNFEELFSQRDTSREINFESKSHNTISTPSSFNQRKKVIPATSAL